MLSLGPLLFSPLITTKLFKTPGLFMLLSFPNHPSPLGHIHYQVWGSKTPNGLSKFHAFPPASLSLPNATPVLLHGPHFHYTFLSSGTCNNSLLATESRLNSQEPSSHVLHPTSSFLVVLYCSQLSSLHLFFPAII